MGWNWLERWMASQPHHMRNLGPHDSSNMSEKTVEMDMAMPMGSGYVAPGRQPRGDTLESSRYSTRQSRQSGSDSIPSYMTPTKSAKAKVKTQGGAVSSKPRNSSASPWNPSTKRGPVFGLGNGDSSSSGGGTAAYQVQKSPISNGLYHAQAKWMAGYSPDSSGWIRRSIDG